MSGKLYFCERYMFIISDKEILVAFVYLFVNKIIQSAKIRLQKKFTEGARVENNKGAIQIMIWTSRTFVQNSERGSVEACQD